MFAPFVTVPLVFGYLKNRQPFSDGLIDKLSVAAIPLATIAAASFIPDPGTLALLLALPWALFTLVSGLLGLLRISQRRSLLDPTIGVDLGLMFLIVGGVWLLLSRAGANPLGFSDAIVELTVVHFHYTGLALPVVTAALLEKKNKRAWLIWFIALGIVATATGITIGGITEFIGANIMTLGGLAVAVELITSKSSQSSRSMLYLLSGLSLIGGMAMAFVWSWSRQLGIAGPTIEFMVITHGVLNAFGFAFLGLIAISLDHLKSEEPRMFHVGRPSEGVLANLYGYAQRLDLTHEDVTTASDWVSSSGNVRSISTTNSLAECKEAMSIWAGHNAAGITKWPTKPKLEVGQRIALSVPAGPLSVLAATEIIEVINNGDEVGFIYATTAFHPESGVEYFGATMRQDATEVKVAYEAELSTLATKYSSPLARYFQQQTINKYLTGLAK